MTKRVGDKIYRLRSALNESQAVFGERFSVEQATVSRWEKGFPVQRKHQGDIAMLAGMSVAEFFHSTDQPRLIPIVGSIISGEELQLEDQRQGQYDVSHIALELGDIDQIAVKVSGDSMFPVYRDGDVLIGTRLPFRETKKVIGHDAIVMTSDGQGYVKIVKAGRKQGTFLLRSYNPADDDIEDVYLEWAAPVIWIGRHRLQS